MYKKIFLILSILFFCIIFCGCIGERGRMGAKGEDGQDGINIFGGSGETNLSAVYPLGSVYVSTLSTNPSITFEGFGTWEYLSSGYYVITGV